LVQPTGSELWRLAYRFAGKQKTLALDIYPAVSVADARLARDAAKKMLAQGIDPSLRRKVSRQEARMAAANTFRLLGEEFMTKQERERRAAATLNRTDGCCRSPTRISATGRYWRSQRSSYLRWCGRLSIGAGSRQPRGCEPAAAWCSDMRLPTAAWSAIRPRTCALS